MVNSEHLVEMVTEHNQTEVTVTRYTTIVSIEEMKTTVDLEISIPAGDDYVTYAAATLSVEEARALAKGILQFAGDNQNDPAKRTMVTTHNQTNVTIEAHPKREYNMPPGVGLGILWYSEEFNHDYHGGHPLREDGDYHSMCASVHLNTDEAVELGKSILELVEGYRTWS